MKTKAPLSRLAQEYADVQSGKIAPGRVWIVTRRPDGTVDRRQVSAKAYQTKRRAETVAENTALPARRVMGVSQGRFAELLGISPATVRNIEQGRTKPTGPTSKLLSIAERFPQIFILSSTAKLSPGKARAMLDKVAAMDGSVRLSTRKAEVDNRRDELTRQGLERRKVQTPTRAKITPSEHR